MATYHQIQRSLDRWQAAYDNMQPDDGPDDDEEQEEDDDYDDVGGFAIE